jgi:hypothetical protein
MSTLTAKQLKILRIKRQLANGTYLTPEKLSKALDAPIAAVGRDIAIQKRRKALGKGPSL